MLMRSIKNKRFFLKKLINYIPAYNHNTAGQKNLFSWSRVKSECEDQKHPADQSSHRVSNNLIQFCSSLRGSEHVYSDAFVVADSEVQKTPTNRGALT